MNDNWYAQTGYSARVIYAQRRLCNDPGHMFEEHTMEPCDLSAREARQLIGRKKLSPRELTASCIRRIEAIDPPSMPWWRVISIAPVTRPFRPKRL